MFTLNQFEWSQPHMAITVMVAAAVVATTAILIIMRMQVSVLTIRPQSITIAVE